MNDKAWIFKEDAFPSRRRLANDALFTLGNGYLGCRGFFEEEQEGVEGLGGIYMAGVFGAGALKAWRGTHRELVNTPNFLWMNVTVDGETVLVRRGNIRGYSRWLNMREGVLYRRFIWRSRQGQRVRFEFERFISMDDLHVAGQRVRITPLDGHPKIEVISGIDAAVTQHNMETTLPLPIQPGRRHLETLTCTSSTLAARVKTLANGVLLAEGQQIAFRNGNQNVRGRAWVKGDRSGRQFSVKATAGQTLECVKTIAFYTSRDGDEQRLLQKRLEQGMDYAALLAAHCQAWERKWEQADITIQGPEEDQRALRFNVFHLIQAAPGHDPRVSLGARGLSGEMHEGSVFWDNEIFKLPFFTFIDPEASRSMLRFRHHTLPEARRHARDLWFDGAMYAWKSGDDGVEETEMGVGAYYAVHIVADIAYAVMQYWQATGDDAFMVRYGAEILFETARFWVSRAVPDPQGKGMSIPCVRGPNEYDVIVNNNAFTNMMAQENCRAACHVYRWMRRVAAADWKTLTRQLKLQTAEPGRWKRCAERLVVPYDAERSLYLEDDRYLHRKPFDMKRGKKGLKRVIDGTLPYEAMAFYQITKQSDVLTMMNLLPSRFTDQEKRNAWDFYEPKTVHDSSLSFAPHAVMAANLNLKKDAYRYFRECAFLDIADKQLNTISGLHLANLGGTWQAVMLGFAGLRLESWGLALEPHLPDAWQSMAFRLRYKGAVVGVVMTADTTTVTLEQSAKQPISVGVSGARRRLSRSGAVWTVDGGNANP